MGNWGRSVSANLTPDPEGLGNYTVENFVNLFRSFQSGIPDAPARPGSIMPWRTLCQLEDRDLEAMYAYLKTVPPRPDFQP